MAKAYYMLEQYDEAELILLEEPSIPCGGNGCGLLGDIYRVTNRQKLACQTYQKGINIDPQLWSLKHKLHMLYEEESNQDSNNEIGKEDDLVTMSINIYNKLDMLVEKNKCSEALSIIHSLPSNSAFIHIYNTARLDYYTASIYTKLGYYSKARALLDRCILKSPWNSEYWVLYCNVLWHLKDIKELTRNGNYFFINDRLSYYTWIAIANSLSLSDNHINAIECLQRANQLEKNNSHILGLIAFEYLSIKNYEEATKYYRYALLLNENNYKVWECLAFIYATSEQYKVSVTFYKKAIELFPENPQLYINISNIYQKLNKNDIAIQYLMKYNKFNPTNPQILTNLALLYQSMKMPKESLYYFEQSFQIEPPNESHFFQIGKSYYDVNQYFNASIYLNKALLTNPPNIEEIQVFINHFI
ncbi:hypothetical protein WA158_000643 [Blastocystis sp. Blastoise]